jgi:hypothetical protein
MESDVPAAVLRLFWDVDPAAIDLDAHRDFVFERVMSRGSWEAMCWLRQRYPVEALAAFVSRDGRSKLSPRDLAYWSLVCGVDTPSEPGGGRPRWAASVEGVHSHERVDIDRVSPNQSLVPKT